MYLFGLWVSQMGIRLEGVVPAVGRCERCLLVGSAWRVARIWAKAKPVESYKPGCGLAGE
ncbi:MAG: hypothetical protein CSA62_12935 [Planctomycetota bacterium]|nr:MAG: hypothetical protein CSA62_12935 [Planctomycetota bacterium]